MKILWIRVRLSFQMIHDYMRYDRSILRHITEKVHVEIKIDVPAVGIDRMQSSHLRALKIVNALTCLGYA